MNLFMRKMDEHRDVFFSAFHKLRQEDGWPRTLGDSFALEFLVMVRPLPGDSVDERASYSVSDVADSVSNWAAHSVTIDDVLRVVAALGWHVHGTRARPRVSLNSAEFSKLLNVTKQMQMQMY